MKKNVVRSITACLVMVACNVALFAQSDQKRSLSKELASQVQRSDHAILARFIRLPAQGGSCDRTERSRNDVEGIRQSNAPGSDR